MYVSNSSAGRSLAQAAVTAYGNKSWSSARAIMRDGFDSIDRSDLTTGDEKSVARLGKVVGDHTMTDANAATARLAIMQALRSGISGPIGQVLASCAMDAYPNEQWSSARAITKDGLQAVAASYETSGREKALANLGVTFGDHTMTDANAATARLSALQAIRNPTGGSRAQALAQASINAYGDKQWSAARAVTRDGLQAIAQDGESSDQDRALARVGIAFGDHTMTDENAATARLAALKEIAYPSAGDGVHRIAQASINAYYSEQWSSARALTEDGLNAIAGYSGANDLQRQLARMGVHEGDHYMPDADAARARLTVLQQIRNQ